MKRRMYLYEDRGVFSRVMETLAEIALVAALGLFLAQYLFLSVSTSSKSMEPTIEPESTVFIDRIRYNLGETKRFDVIAFSRTGEPEDRDYLIRRVIGLPGEEIQISKGVVYINGKMLDVSGYTSEITSDGIAGDALLLGDDEYFVLGDTPANSEDSRSSTIGAVKKRLIVGKAWFAVKSATEFRLIQ